MKIEPSQRQIKQLVGFTSVFAIIFLTLSVVIPVLSAPSVFDWDTITWSPGATGATYTGIGIPGTEFTFSSTGDTSQFANSSPAVNQIITGGAAENTLFIAVDFLNTSQSITFTTDISPTSATNVSFTVMDLDGADTITDPPGEFDNVDEIEVLGYDYLGIPVLPTMVAANASCVTVVGNVATGTCMDVDNATNNGNVTVTFTSAIKQVVINYREGANVQADPTEHGIAIHDINFTPAALLDLNNNGNGTIASEPDSPTYEPGQVVTLTATADPGWTFSTWSGDLSGSTSPITITMASDKIITGTFTQDQYTVSVTPPTGGTIGKDPDQSSYVYGEVITFTATADPGWTFAGWSGDLSGTTNPTTVTVDGNKNISATFTQDHYTVSVTPPTGGAIDKNPDQSTYVYGEVITFTATAAPGWTFVNWTGDLSGGDNPKTLSVVGNHTVGANFSQNSYTLLTNTVGNGVVGKNPDQASFAHDQVVTVTATAAPGWTFAGWNGDLSGTTNPTTLTMDGNKNITATFTQDHYTVTILASANGMINRMPQQMTYVYGDVITFTAVANPGYTFINWTGDLSGSENPTTLVVTGNHTVGAVFGVRVFLPLIVRN